MGIPNYTDPQTLLGELKSRQTRGQSVDDLLPYIVATIETQQRHPDYWVSQRLDYWLRYPGTFETDTKHWITITPAQWTALAKLFEKRGE